jgi:hypothetical protein
MRPAAILLALCLGASCATDRGAAPAGGIRSQAEVRNFQTRSYAVADQPLVMKAMINVLQDLNFIVKTADAQLGVITAEKWSNIEHSRKEIKRAKKEKTGLAEAAVLECTANVSIYGNETRVRVTFQQRIVGPGGTVINVTRVEDAPFYQEFFAKVGKGIFLQQEGI